MNLYQAVKEKNKLLSASAAGLVFLPIHEAGIKVVYTFLDILFYAIMAATPSFSKPRFQGARTYG